MASQVFERNLIQYVIVRTDLINDLKWPLGAVIAQACHATAAVNHIFRNDSDTQSYLSDENIDHMHKAVLKVNNEPELLAVAKRLTDNAIQYKLWTEQPENIPTCIAIKPYEKPFVHKFVNKLRLLS